MGSLQRAIFSSRCMTPEMHNLINKDYWERWTFQKYLRISGWWRKCPLAEIERIYPKGMMESMMKSFLLLDYQHAVMNGLGNFWGSNLIILFLPEKEQNRNMYPLNRFVLVDRKANRVWIVCALLEKPLTLDKSKNQNTKEFFFLVFSCLRNF